MQAHKKIMYRKSERATTNLNIRMKSSRRGASNGVGHIFISPVFGQLFLLSVWGQEIYFFSISYASFGILVKGMGESFLLSKDEHLTLDIDGVMAL